MKKDKNFIYFLITTADDKTKNFLERDTFSYRFNRNIANHIQSRLIISNFPKSMCELLIPWPISLLNCRTNYITEYINIKLLENNTDSIINIIKQTYLGCIFVPEELKDHPSIQGLNELKLPVVFINKNTEISSSQFQLIIDKNNENASQLLGRNIKISDKTNIEPIAIPKKRFLIPLAISINRNRGLYLSTLKNETEPKVSINEVKKIAEEQAVTDIKRYFKILITEKYITYLSTQTKGIDSLINIIKEWDESINTTDLEIDIFEKYFIKLSNYFFEKFDQIFYRMNMVFVLPMVNKTSVDMINKVFQMELSKPILRQIYDSFGYYGFPDQKSLKKNESDVIEAVLIDRLLENSILDSLCINFTLGSNDSFIRLPNIPSKDIAMWYSHMTKNAANSDNFSEVSKFNNNFHKISEIMRLALDDNMIDIIIKNGNHIKFLTDAPIEWIKYRNVPLGLIKSTSRLPIIPGNTLVHLAKLNSKIRIVKQDVSFLIINTLKKNDNFYKNGKKLGELLREYFPSHYVRYYEVTNKDDFIRIINENPTTFFIYYGHGSMPEIRKNLEVQIGQLHIGKDVINMIELESSIKVPPVITLLGACQTQVLDSHYLNIGNMFLSLGSLSVLATYFPVDGDYTFSLIESIFRHLKNYFNGTVPIYIKNWADIVFQARRTHYITEPISSIIKYLEKRKYKIRIDSLELRTFVMEYCLKSSERDNKGSLNSIEKIVLYRDEAYKEYFKNYPEETIELIDYFFKQNYVFPESIIFTSLGSPEQIDFFDE